MAWHVAAKTEELGDGEVIGVMVEGEAIALYKIDGAVYATNNICTHEHAMLSDGYLEGGSIECPLHQARFDIKTGAALCAPATDPVACYPVRIEGDRIMVELKGR